MSLISFCIFLIALFLSLPPVHSSIGMCNERRKKNLIPLGKVYLHRKSYFNSSKVSHSIDTIRNWFCFRMPLSFRSIILKECVCAYFWKLLNMLTYEHITAIKGDYIIEFNVIRSRSFLLCVCFFKCQNIILMHSLFHTASQFIIFFIYKIKPWSQINWNHFLHLQHLKKSFCVRDRKIIKLIKWPSKVLFEVRMLLLCDH